MFRMKSFAFGLGLFLAGFGVLRAGAAVITNPAPNQVFAAGTAVVKIGWTPVAGADTYSLKLLHNGTEFALLNGIKKASRTVSGTFPPGYYTAVVRSVTGASEGMWSMPLTFLIDRQLTPGDVYDSAPAVFRWSRAPGADRYQLKLSQYDAGATQFVSKAKVWVPQPASGAPKWRPAPSVISAGQYRWSITDYAGEKRGFTSVANFTVLEAPADDYLVIDLSGGVNAKSYPVTYLSDVPAGGWTDAYKTWKLVMRKITAGTFSMGSPTNELGREDDESKHKVTLTRDFYIGVFEVTQIQWELVMGDRPSFFNNNLYYVFRPVEQVAYEVIRGSSAGASWPKSRAVDAGSFMGKIRAKTGLATFDLPTEAQWEYACRAGTTNALNNEQNLTATDHCVGMNEVGRYWYNGGSGWGGGARTGGLSVATAKVGSYKVNAWGLYDMHGNVWERCLDWYEPYAGKASDPAGAVSGEYRVTRGGSWQYPAQYQRSADRYEWEAPSSVPADVGFRAARIIP